MLHFAHLPIARRIGLGFGAVIVVLGAVGGFGLVTTGQLDRDFRRADDMSADALLASEINADMAKTLVHARAYVDTRDPGQLETTRAYLDETAAGVARAQAVIEQPERAERVDRMDEALGGFTDELDGVVELYAARDALYDELAGIGGRMQAHVREIAETAAQDGDLETAWRAAATEEVLMAARLGVVKFLLDNRAEDREAFAARLAEAERSFAELEASVADPRRRRLLAELRTFTADYAAGSDELADVIVERNRLREAAIDEIGPAINAWAAEVKTSAVEESRALNDAVAAASARNRTVTIAIVAAGLLAGLGLAVVIGRSIARPVSTITAAMNQLAGGDVETTVPHRGRGDEIGAMAAALQVFKDAMLERRELTRRLADDFQGQVGGVIETVAAAANQLVTTADGVKDAAATTTGQASSVASSAEQASSNVQTVATASEEMATSVHEITGQISETRRIAGDAAEAAERMRGTMDQLAENASEIGGVVDLITSIADQTNLLSLNATIEAARAGEAGRGFAVVAQEVKSLAGQTRKATEEIAGKIAALQEASKATGADIADVGDVIRNMTEIATSIAAAMEEQSTATNDIARNVQEAAAGNADVSRVIAEVAQVAEASDRSAAELTSAADDLKSHASDLDTKVRRFLDGLRAA